MKVSGRLLIPVERSVAFYIRAQRDNFAPQAKAIDPFQRQAMTRFFRPQLLESARVLVLGDNTPVRLPRLYAATRKLAAINFLSTVVWSAITFDNIIVSHVPFSDALLFHELVHVEQYFQLGIRRFAELYVRGFFSGRSYHRIPLEVNAYTLTERFQFEPERAFSVEEQVRACIGGNRF